MINNVLVLRLIVVMCVMHLIRVMRVVLGVEVLLVQVVLVLVLVWERGVPLLKELLVASVGVASRYSVVAVVPVAIHYTVVPASVYDSRSFVNAIVVPTVVIMAAAIVVPTAVTAALPPSEDAAVVS